MVRVEAPPSAPPAAPSARDPVAPWFVVVAASLLIAALFTWERWCDPAEEIQSARCFTAHMWGGSASLMGLAGLVLTGVFLLASLRVGLRSRLGTPRLALFAAALTAVMAKSLIAQQNGTLSGAVGEFDPSRGVTTTASLIAVAGGVILLLDLAFRWPRFRPFLAAVAATVVVAVISSAYASSGLAWWGGPLAEPEFLGGGNGAGYRVKPGEPVLFDGLLFVRNRGDVTAVLDDVDLVDPDGHILIDGTYVIDGDCPPGALDLVVEDRNGCAYAVDGFRIEPGGRSSGVMLALLFEVPKPGVYRSGWFRIRYHVGPLRFEIFRTDQLVICSPEPGEKRCPGGDLLGG